MERTLKVDMYDIDVIRLGNFVARMRGEHHNFETIVQIDEVYRVE